jgi:hypothetical protein
MSTYRDLGLRSPIGPRLDEVLAADALQFVAELQHEFETQRCSMFRRIRATRQSPSRTSQLTFVGFDASEGPVESAEPIRDSDSRYCTAATKPAMASCESVPVSKPWSTGVSSAGRTRSAGSDLPSSLRIAATPVCGPKYLYADVSRTSAPALPC